MKRCRPSICLALLLLGGFAPSRARTPLTYPDVIIDFGACARERRVVGFAFGSTIFEVEGKVGDRCVIKYGTEIENPRWDGSLDNVCRVPLHLGRRAFRVGDGGVDFASLKPYCVNARPAPGRGRRGERSASPRRRLTKARARPATH